MSYFSTEKKIKISIMGVHCIATQSIGGTWTDLTIFSTDTQVQIASYIGYPVIVTNASTIDLEAGWKYFIDLKLKASDSTPTAGENLQYRITDSSGASIISSVGSLGVYRDSAYAYSQEKCICYIDAMSSAQTVKFQAIKIGGGTISLNSSYDTGNTNFRSHFLIKAWK